jgi:ribosome-associated protein
MYEIEIEKWVRNNIQVSFSRSSGPGGQNVNKRDTKVTARINITHIDILSYDEMEMLKSNLSHRLNRKGELVIKVQDSRSQSTNREIAVERTSSLLRNALSRKKKRRPTKPTRLSEERRITQKKLLGRKKNLRRKIDYQE